MLFSHPKRERDRKVGVDQGKKKKRPPNKSEKETTTNASSLARRTCAAAGLSLSLFVFRFAKAQSIEGEIPRARLKTLSFFEAFLVEMVTKRAWCFLF